MDKANVVWSKTSGGHQFHRKLKVADESLRCKGKESELTAVSVYACSKRSKCLSVKLLVIPLTVVAGRYIVYTSNHKSLLSRTL